MYAFGLSKSPLEDEKQSETLSDKQFKSPTDQPTSLATVLDDLPETAEHEENTAEIVIERSQMFNDTVTMPAGRMDSAKLIPTVLDNDLFMKQTSDSNVFL